MPYGEIFRRAICGARAFVAESYLMLPSVVAFVVGLITVLQSGLNKKISMSEGLPAAVALNALVIFIVALSFYFVQKNGFVSMPDNLKSVELFQIKKWWFIIPGICGFLLVMGYPFSISYMGAAKVFVIAIAGQCVGSLMWDALVEQNAPNPLKLVGVALTLLGAFLTSLK